MAATNTNTANKSHKFRLKRIFRIGSGLFIYSIIPILSWIVLGFVKGDARIENVFSITYPMGFVWAIMVSLFGTAANIRANKEGDENAIYSSAFWGIIISAIAFIIPTIFVDGYISFFGQDVEFYREYVIYAFLLTIVQIMFSYVIEKLYFEDKEKQANRHLFAFNLMNFAVLILTNLIFDKFITSMIITLVAVVVYVVVLYIKHFKKFKIDFSFFKNFKYESANVISYLFMFTIYFFGLKNAFCAGEEYVLALSIVGLSTDAFWDSMQAIAKIAKIDLAKKRYDYKNELKNASIYSVIVVFISIILTISLGLLNGANMGIVLVYLSFQVFDMLVDPFRNIMLTYTQLEYSPLLNTVLNFGYKAIRTVLAIFLISPYCTEIGQMTQGILLMISYIIIRVTKYKMVDGKLVVKGKQTINNKTIDKEN